MKKTIFPRKCPECGKWSRLKYEIEMLECVMQEFIGVTCPHCNTRVTLPFTDCGKKSVKRVKRAILFKFKYMKEYWTRHQPRK